MLPKSGKGKILNLGPLTKRRQTDVLPLLSWTEKAFSKTQLDINTLFTERKVRIACTTSITVFGNKESKKMYSSKFLNFYWLVFFFFSFFFCLSIFNRPLYGFSQVDQAQLAKSVHTAGKSAIKLVNLLRLKVIQLNGAKIYM